MKSKLISLICASMLLSGCATAPLFKKGDFFKGYKITQLYEQTIHYDKFFLIGFTGEDHKEKYAEMKQDGIGKITLEGRTYNIRVNNPLFSDERTISIGNP